MVLEMTRDTVECALINAYTTPSPAVISQIHLSIHQSSLYPRPPSDVVLYTLAIKEVEEHDLDLLGCSMMAVVLLR